MLFLYFLLGVLLHSASQSVHTSYIASTDAFKPGRKSSVYSYDGERRRALSRKLERDHYNAEQFPPLLGLIRPLFNKISVAIG